MINPKIIKEYGDNGAKMIKGLCDIMTEEEKNTTYALGHHSMTVLSGVPFNIACTEDKLIDSLSLKIMEYFFNLDPNTIVMCEKYEGDGIKIWLTT